MSQWRQYLVRGAFGVFGTAGDAGWFLLGLIPWVLTLWAATIQVENGFTHHKFRFPGWWK